MLTTWVGVEVIDDKGVLGCWPLSNINRVYPAKTFSELLYVNSMAGSSSSQLFY